MGNKITSYILSQETNLRPLHKLTGNYTCKVVDVYDGDTVTITILNNCAIQKYKLRMYGYDSPEMKPKKTLENRELEIEKANMMLDFVILQKEERIKLQRTPKQLFMITQLQFIEENIHANTRELNVSLREFKYPISELLWIVRRNDAETGKVYFNYGNTLDTIKCGHIICDKCVREIMKHSKTLQCPLCRVNQEIEGGLHIKYPKHLATLLFNVE